MTDDQSDEACYDRHMAATEMLRAGAFAEAFAEFLTLARAGYAPSQHLVGLCFASSDMPDEALGKEGEGRDREVEAAAWDYLSVLNKFKGAGLIFRQAILDPEWRAAMNARRDELEAEFPSTMREVRPEDD
ncbi:hypothetical protein [Gimibacter soli]|uniref:Uncharacterized protein n=1 Tax=Gimibacter soli TaxID=3024400 RepID=A0AAE9XT36_9PROT|nr:hypothetical protein [Gimibacter soli]WCL54610.1 hypothetical protein PH603_02410 [Gimibacter soli]